MHQQNPLRLTITLTARAEPAEPPAPNRPAAAAPAGAQRPAARPGGRAGAEPRAQPRRDAWRGACRARCARRATRLSGRRWGARPRHSKSYGWPRARRTPASARQCAGSWRAAGGRRVRERGPGVTGGHAGVCVGTRGARGPWGARLPYRAVTGMNVQRHASSLSLAKHGIAWVDGYSVMSSHCRWNVVTCLHGISRLCQRLTPALQLCFRMHQQGKSLQTSCDAVITIELTSRLSGCPACGQACTHGGAPRQGQLGCLCGQRGEQQHVRRHTVPRVRARGVLQRRQRCAQWRQQTADRGQCSAECGRRWRPRHCAERGLAVSWPSCLCAWSQHRGCGGWQRMARRKCAHMRRRRAHRQLRRLAGARPGSIALAAQPQKRGRRRGGGTSRCSMASHGSWNGDSVMCCTWRARSGS